MLSKSVGYAITALGFVAAHEKPVLVKDISTTTGIPYAYLAKIIHGLSKKRIVETRKGFGGGVLIPETSRKLSLYDLCVSLDDPIVGEPRCMLGEDKCSDERSCPAHLHYIATRRKTIRFLKSKTIDEIAKFELQRNRLAYEIT